MDNRVIKHIILSDNNKADLDAKYWGGLEPEEKQDVLVSGVNIKTINGENILGSGNIEIEEGGNSHVYENIIEVLYSDLVNLRNNSELIPGKKYRITDYVTTTSQENTLSAGHKFDIIVTALTKNELSEIAYTCYHYEDIETPYITEFESAYVFENKTGNFIFHSISKIGGDNEYFIYQQKENEKNLLAFDFNDITKVYFNGDGIKFIPSYYVAPDYGYNIWTENDDNDNYLIPYINSSYGKNEEKCKKEFNRNYFKNLGCNLSAWKIWYSLDNSDRFAWAKSNGTGVIYRMIDEWGNDCPYDFKNIQFKRWLYADGGGITDEENGDFESYCYTFSCEDSYNNIMDASIFGNNGYLSNDSGDFSNVYGNIIGIYNFDGGKQYLNNIVFLSSYSYEDRLFYGCINNSFGNNCYNNTFGNDCNYNIFGNSCCHNTFSNHCLNNTFDNNCESNTFGNDCRYNTFGNDCRYNKFSNQFLNNTFGNNCESNKFSNDCQYNTFSNDCRYNKFSNHCMNNTFGNNCESNIFGEYCQYNTFGNNCESNTFVDNCQYNTFGNNCTNNKFKTNDELTSYFVEYLYFDDGCSFNTIIINGENGDEVKNYNINKGVYSKEITIKYINSDIEVNVWVTSSGDVVQEYINDYMTDSDIDEIWNKYF